MNIDRFVAKCRQWAFPAEFRIPVGDWHQWADVLADVLATDADGDSVDKASGRERSSASSQLGEKQPEECPEENHGDDTNRLDPDFSKNVCNRLHELSNLFPKLEEKGTSKPDLARLEKALQRVRDALKARHIEFQDMAGQHWDPGRCDFESIGRSEVVEGLAYSQVILCERPAVFLNGRLIQKARGLVGVPSGGMQSRTQSLAEEDTDEQIIR